MFDVALTDDNVLTLQVLLSDIPYILFSNKSSASWNTLEIVGGAETKKKSKHTAGIAVKKHSPETILWPCVRVVFTLA